MNSPQQRTYDTVEESDGHMFIVTIVPENDQIEYGKWIKCESCGIEVFSKPSSDRLLYVFYRFSCNDFRIKNIIK